MMKWKKIGKIFDPTQHEMLAGCSQFAQSPQALVFEQFVRIYFSTRSMDVSGKYLSHVAFVDMCPRLRETLRVSSHVVIPLGNLGCFDEHGIFPISPMRVGEKIYGYTCGWSRRVSVPVETAIGLAFSDDNGMTFQRQGEGPVLAASLKEPCLVGDGFVRRFAGQFHMWYIFGLGWKRYGLGLSPERIYKIGHAISDDGIRWVKEEGKQIIPDRIGSDECQALPAVIEIDGRYHMFFCYRYSVCFRNDKDRGYRIGHAWSENLIDWVRDDANPLLEGSSGEWDSDMQCYPHVFACQGEIYLLYNGNEFGQYGFGLAVLEHE